MAFSRLVVENVTVEKLKLSYTNYLNSTTESHEDKTKPTESYVGTYNQNTNISKLFLRLRTKNN